MVQDKIWYIEISRQFTGLTDSTVVLLIWIVLVPLRIQTKGFIVYSALWAINEVRKNADMPLLTSMGKEEFLERLYNEWRVEFAFEDHRFWDVRRWKIADTTQRELYGVKIEKQQNGTLSFYKNLYESRTWRDCMYLYPIPQSELYKNTNLNPQNAGW